MIEKGHISIDILDNLVGQIIKNLGILRKNDIINEQSVNNYSEMVKRNVHSWLQWSIIEAGRELNLICVPEVKFRFLRPLNPSDFGMLNKRLRRFIKVDVAIYEKFGKLSGLAECITFDLAHECFTTEEVNYKWLTVRDRLPYAVRNLELRPQFVVLIVILPMNAKQVPWKTGREEIDKILETKKYFEKLGPKWKELVDIIKNDTDTKLILINETVFSTYP